MINSVKIEDLNKLITNPDNWADKLINRSQEKLKQYWLYKNFDFVSRQFIEFKEFLEIYESLNDNEINELVNKINELKKHCEKLKIKSLLNKETDDCNAFLEIHAGAGGTESQDWWNC